MITLKEKQLAADLRDLARQCEAHRASGSKESWFTCNAISREFTGGRDVREAYVRAFGLDHNQIRLWDMEHDEMYNVRVLMLCFAAAMAETGDLLP